MVRLAFVISALLASAGPTCAGGLAPDEAVALVRDALKKAGLPEADAIAPSRPLPECAGDIAVGPSGSTWATAVLHCDQPRWTRMLRVPQGPRAAENTVAHETPNTATNQRLVVALQRSKAKGEMLTKKDLQLVPASTLVHEQVYDDLDVLVGRRLDRAVGAGMPLHPRHLEPDWLVSPDSTVLILSDTNGISVAIKGTPTEAGALGDSVQVTNLSSGKTVIARVIGRDLVRVQLKPFGTVP